MRFFCGVALALALAVAGCERVARVEGPKVDQFVGRLTQGGQPVSFPGGETVQLQVIHEKGQSFGIPIQPDGSFKIGWMPIGKYTATLTRQKPGTKGGVPVRHPVPGGLTIADGQTEYTVELGKGFKA